MNIFLSEHKSGNPHYNWWCSFEVCIYGNLTFADRLTFCQPIRSGMPFAASTFHMVFVTAFSPRLLPNHFLFRPLSSFRTALTLTLQTTKEKTHQKNWKLCRLTDGKGKRWITISMLVCWRNNSLFTLS